MTDLIQRMCPSAWFYRLEDQDRKSIEDCYQRAQKEGIDIGRLAGASLGQKARVINLLGVMPAEFQASIDGIRKLRNDLAHANALVEDGPSLTTFVARYKSACRWVDEIQKKLNE